MMSGKAVWPLCSPSPLSISQCKSNGALPFVSQCLELNSTSRTEVIVSDSLVLMLLMDMSYLILLVVRYIGLSLRDRHFEFL